MRGIKALTFDIVAKHFGELARKLGAWRPGSVTSDQ
jgi:hypothetical protein